MDAQQKKFVFFLILAVIVGTLVGSKLLPPEQPRLRVGQAEVKIEIADTVEKRSTGLSGRDSLAADAGMMFVFSEPGQYGFWMRGMRFPLDFVWIRDGKVVEITEDVPVSNENVPKVYQPQQPIEAMVEVNAGWVKKQGVKVGDEIVIE